MAGRIRYLLSYQYRMAQQYETCKWLLLLQAQQLLVSTNLSAVERELLSSMLFLRLQLEQMSSASSDGAQPPSALSSQYEQSCTLSEGARPTLGSKATTNIQLCITGIRS